MSLRGAALRRLDSDWALKTCLRLYQTSQKKEPVALDSEETPANYFFYFNMRNDDILFSF